MIKREAKLSDTIIRLNMAIVERDTELSKAQALSDKQLVLLKKSKLYFDWFVFEYETDHIEGFDLLMSELKEAIDA
jgi:hypothetical protein